MNWIGLLTTVWIFGGCVYFFAGLRQPSQGTLRAPNPARLTGSRFQMWLAVSVAAAMVSFLLLLCG